MVSIVALLHGPDRPGIVAKIAGWIHERGGNVLHADQHLDREEDVFFQRVEWCAAEEEDLDAESDLFAKMAEKELGMKVRMALSNERPPVVLFVSKADHCLHDLILRWKAEELRGEIVGVVSNHADLDHPTQEYGLPFLHIPCTKENRAEAEAAQLEFIRKQGAGLVVLARYMQVLGENFLNQVDCPVINIHHSFLPSFAGAKPYHQAYRRGVKIIGATAHFVTPALDEGPIICQDVNQVSHRNGVRDLIAKGRDLEKIVLATAVRRQLENRILVYKNKTVVFD
ncbi:formyltetrahydrofolate deformylase [Opitutales bacterium]|jgi:formyltetrahydrofolate deformylase|nr:formyltetrahydrofolate deformylase [Opitutales bacterium]